MIKILIYLYFLLQIFVCSVKINIWITFLFLKTFYITLVTYSINGISLIQA